MTRYDDFIRRKRAEYGDKFDPSELAPQFIESFNNGQCIRVAFAALGIMSGVVRVTIGSRPTFIMNGRGKDSDYSFRLRRFDKIIAVKRGRKYVIA